MIPAKNLKCKILLACDIVLHITDIIRFIFSRSYTNLHLHHHLSLNPDPELDLELDLDLDLHLDRTWSGFGSGGIWA